MKRVQLPYDFPEPGTPEDGVRNEPCALGEMAGAELARLTGEVPTACDECAFRKGAIGNRCLPTVAAAIKCVMEGVPFYCHKDGLKPSHTGSAAMQAR